MSLTFNAVSFFVVLMMASVGAANTDDDSDLVEMVKVFTSDCEDCGMGSNGNLTIILLIYYGEGTCPIEDLTNFEKGTVRTLKGSDLQSCDGIDISTQEMRPTAGVELWHSGSDNVKIDKVQVFTTGGLYECHFKRMLENEDEEEATGVSGDCTYPAPAPWTTNT